MSTLQTKLGSDPTFPWVPYLKQDDEGDWYCAPTKEDLEIHRRISEKYNMYVKADLYDYYAKTDFFDYYIMRDKA